MYYETQFAGINLQSSQSESTPKCQLISKQDCRAVTSPKKRTKRTQDILVRDLLTFRRLTLDIKVQIDYGK